MTLTDIFCSYALIIPDSGSVLIAGGTNWTGSDIDGNGNADTTIFRSNDETLASSAGMNRPRYYATATPLMNGEIYVQGGKGGEDFPEVRGINGNFRILSGAPTSNYDWYYPRNFLASDGRVFGFDVTGLMHSQISCWKWSYDSRGRVGAYWCLRVSTTAMFRPGKILQVVGKNRNALVIDINSPQPVVTATDSLPIARNWANATVLPTGQVVVTGGSRVANQLVEVSNQAVDPGSRNRKMDSRRLRLEAAPIPLDRIAAA